MNKSLKNNPELIDKLFMLVRGQGLRIATAARQLGLKPRHCQEFFAQEKAWMVDWWNDNQEAAESYFNGFSEEDTELCRKKDEIITSLLRNAESGVFTGGNYPEDKPKKILIIADTQAKPDVSLDYLKWIGKYIFDKKPDIVVHIGDHYDFPSLSSYDKGKKSFEGRRLKADIDAGNLGMELLLKEFQKDGYNPRLVFCTGNHEFRFDRLADEMPELDGFVGTDTLPLAAMGWEVQPFLKPINIEGIFFVHYLANPMTGKPYGGNAMNQLKTVGNSFVVGHKQCLDVAIRPTLDGKHQIGIINGAAYDFEEPYKGYTGNNHFRGITMLHEVKDGFGLPSFVSLEYLKARYGS